MVVVRPANDNDNDELVEEHHVMDDGDENGDDDGDEDEAMDTEEIEITGFSDEDEQHHEVEEEDVDEDEEDDDDDDNEHNHLITVVTASPDREESPSSTPPGLPPPPPALSLLPVPMLVLQRRRQQKKITISPKQRRPATGISAAPTAFVRCSVCPFGSHSQTLVNRHEKTAHLKKKFFRCMKCNYVTHMRARYTKHVKYHTMPMIKCTDCDFRTPYKWNLDRHNRNHSARSPGMYKCTHCSFSADIKQSLTVHETNHHVPPVGGVYPPHVSSNRRRYRVGASDAPGSAVDGTEVRVSSGNALRRGVLCVA